MTLRQVGHEHHERILAYVNTIPDLADRLLAPHGQDVGVALGEARTFLLDTLIPHLDAAEAAVYGELERLLQNRHSMTPMRAEHATIRRLVDEFAALTRDQGSAPTPVPTGRALALRRVLFHLYAILKVHLAEEEAYLAIVQHEVAGDAAELIAAAMEHPVAGR